MRFADIPGHSDIKARLVAMADSNHVPHAVMLEGVGGICKYALARAWAQYIHCTNRHDGDSCGVCASCQQHNSFNHIDTLYSFPVVKKNSKPTISDDYMPEFRDFLNGRVSMDFEKWLEALGNVNAQPQIYVEEAAALLDRLNLTARSSDYKIVLLWLPERLQVSAANKLLKLVEEPSDDTIFIMASDNPAAVLPTIYSRTQRITVNRYADIEVERYLSDRSIDLGEAKRIAPLAEGSLTKAMRMTESDAGESSKFLPLFTSLMRLAWQRKIKDLRDWAAEIAGLGREGSMMFYEYSAHMLRENFILNIGQPDLNNLADDEMKFSAKFSPFINERNVVDLITAIDEARNDTAMNGNGKIIAFDTAVKVIMLLRR